MLRKIIITGALFITLTSCSLAPQFTTPKVETPAAFKEEGAAEGSWKAAEPLAAEERGAWWKVFGDAKLDDLEQKAAAANQTLKAASARVLEARATAGMAAPDNLPNISAGANVVRSEEAAAVAGTPHPFPYTAYQAAGIASWEPDFFGRVRDEHKALKLDAEGQQAAYNIALLSLQADVAQDYFSLRALDAERALLRDAVKIRTESARIMNKRFKAGVVGEQDDARTEGELQTAKADLTSTDRRRAMMEHALAVLLGQPPASFTFEESALTGAPPKIPGGLPSSLLTRRPDISQALSSMAAANQRIGAAKAAFFPDLSLNATGGFEAATLGSLFQWSSRTWALGQVAGLALSLPIFDNGRHSAGLDRARAAYDEAVANYRQQVLVAFRDAEDNLSEQRLLAEQAEQQDAAAKAGDRAERLARIRYDAGETEYLEVSDANRTALEASRAAVQVNGQRFVTTVTLIRALGGGW